MSKALLYKILTHLSVWALFYWASYNYYVQWLPTVDLFFPAWRIHAYTVVYLLLTMAVPYLSYFVLLPRYFFKRQYWPYALCILVAAGAMLHVFCWVDFVFLLPYRPEWLFSQGHYWSRLPYLVLFSLLANWYRMSEELAVRERREAELQQAKTQSELRWLQAQVSPHFLFNALNNIYSLVYLGSEQAGPMLVRLSDMMRYVLQESHAEKVPLEKEIAYIEHYVGMMSLKKRWEGKITWQAENRHPGLLVEPMLFINFVENAFKHSNLDKAGAYLHIHLEARKEELIFEAENTFQDTGRKDATGGIGLTNVRQRLTLLYPSRHCLTISDKNGVYQVRLQIQF